MFKKIVYVSLFLLIFLLAVQSASASDTNLNDVYLDDSDFDDSLSLSDSSDLGSSIEDDSLILDDGESEDIDFDDSSNNNEGSDEDPQEETRNETVISSNPISFDYASQGELKINLSDSNGVGLSDKNVSVKINDFVENITTDISGIAVFKFSNAAGTYDAFISFDGDESYAPSNASTKITITKASTKLTVPSVKGYLSSSTYVVATLLDSKGNAIANKKVSVVLGGTTYNGTTNSNGIAKVKIPNKIGNYSISVKFAGDGNYTSSSANSKVEITKMKTSLLAPSVKSYMTKDTYLTVTLKDVFGKGIANKTITVKVGKKTHNLTTDKNGVAKLKFERKVGTYNCTVKFKETETFYGASKTSKVVISKMPTTLKAPKITFKSNKYGKFIINLTDVDGKGLKNKTITISIPSIKKVYKVKTNSEGIATFNFNGPKTYNVTVKYAGSKYYTAKSVKSQFIVKKVKIKFKDVISAAVLLKKYISKNKELPENIVYKEYNFTTAQLSYVMAVAVRNINKKNHNDILLLAASTPANASGEIYDTVYRKNYLKIAKKAVGSSIRHKTPSYIKHSIYKIPYNVYTAEFSRALSFYKEHKRLPKYVLFTSSEFVKVKDNGKYTFYLTSDNIRGKKSELKMLKSLQKALKSKGYNAVIVGIGPDIHNIAYRYGCKGKNSVLLAVFGGVDVGCIEEWTGELKNSNRNFVDNYNGAHVLGLWFKKPYGASSSIHHRIGRAWDANYGHPLNNPAKYMSKHNISYIQTGTVSSACTLLKEGKMGGPKLIE